jgi:hypothetical protein
LTPIARAHQTGPSFEYAADWALVILFGLSLGFLDRFGLPLDDTCTARVRSLFSRWPNFQP